MNKGLLIVFSGPSGVGKGTVLKELMKEKDLNLAYSISMTTRKPRPNEKDGINYYFVDEKRFKEAIENGELLEYATFVDNYYGTPKVYVEKMRDEGNNVILEIETVGAKQIMNAYKGDKGFISIFLTPPNINELEKRIRKRRSESDEVIKRRILKASQELSETSLYDCVVCNDDLDKAVEEISSFIKDNIERLN